MTSLPLLLERHRAARLSLRAMLGTAPAGLEAELAALDAIEADLAQASALQASALAVERDGPEHPARARLVQSQKLEAIGQLTGGIAHDFNNLLTVITAGLQLLSRANAPERRSQLTQRIEEAAWRGADLTRRLLAFARREPLTPRALDLAQHIESMRELLRHGLPHTIRIEIDTSQRLWPVLADLAVLEVAVLNLAVNARDAMPNGGTIILGARNMGSDDILQTEVEPGEYVRLFVTDTGPGMTPEAIARAFEPFFTTKPPGKGTGLGLAQVYGFARQSGGTAWVESRPGEGATVSILLPRAAMEPAHGEPPDTPARAHAIDAGKTILAILVVEDDDGVASLALDMLDQLGHRGVRVSSLPAAIAVLAGSDCIDIIFSDVLLGQTGSGLDLAREVARRNLDIPIILTSGFGDEVTGRIAAARLPFLRKPYTLDALRDTLRTVATAGEAPVRR